MQNRGSRDAEYACAVGDDCNGMRDGLKGRHPWSFLYASIWLQARIAANSCLNRFDEVIR